MTRKKLEMARAIVGTLPVNKPWETDGYRIWYKVGQMRHTVAENLLQTEADAICGMRNTYEELLDIVEALMDANTEAEIQRVAYTVNESA